MPGRTAIIVAMMTVAASAEAQSTPSAAPAAGEDMYQRARSSWEHRQFAASEPLYKEALNLGQLAPDQTLDCYIHLGAARAVMKRKEGALAAFREAALLDPKFAVPVEGGKRVALLAAQAKRDEAKVGAVSLTAEAPETSAVGATIKVQAKLDAAHAAIFARIGILARDPAGEASYANVENAAATVDFEVPANIAVAKGTVFIRIAALDMHDNRLVSVERKVIIEAAPVPIAAPILAVSEVPPAAKKEGPQRKDEKKAGFFATPWPYVIGGFALAAGGAAVFFLTRPTDNVTVGAPRVQVGGR